MHPQSVRNLFQFRLPLPGSKCLLVEVVKNAAIPQRAARNQETLLITAQRDRVRGVGLELARIRAGVLGGFDDAYCLGEILAVIGGHLRNAIDGTSPANATFPDLDVETSHWPGKSRLLH